MHGEEQETEKDGEPLNAPSGEVDGRSMALIRHSRELERLLQNALEQNRLLLEERHFLRKKIGWLQERRRRARENNLDLLAFLVNLHLEGHRTAMAQELSLAIGRDLGLEKVQLWRLSQASRLYPLGLFHVPKSQHQKRGLCFSATQEDIPVQVPLAAARMLEALDGMAGLAAVLRHLGERCDGSGGPDGLKGRRIPVESRILSVVLAYQESLHDCGTSAEVLRRMRGEALWDPDVLAVLQHHAQDGGDLSCRIRIWDLTPGMILAAPVHARAGAMLLPEGTCITAHHLKQLVAYSGAGPLEDMVTIRKEGLPLKD